uniref:Uncharacterized protein n=2 Tax=Spironucleus salmonicida TaxID=348837 RepID=V6LV31_9EUKA|eukprot:EST48440.1 Hypothetical protein SS50377_11390 [Spironucleus salmonicida]
MSQIYKKTMAVTFGLHPRFIQKPMEYLETLLNLKLGKQIEGGSNSILVGYQDLEMINNTAEISPYSPLLVVQAKATLLVFSPQRKFVAVNNAEQNKAVARGIFSIENPAADEVEVCAFKSFQKGKIVVDWF